HRSVSCSRLYVAGVEMNSSSASCATVTSARSASRWSAGTEATIDWLATISWGTPGGGGMMIAKSRTPRCRSSTSSAPWACLRSRRMPGCSTLKADSRSGTSPAPIVSGKPNLIVPRSGSAASAISVSAVWISHSGVRTAATRSRAASVSTMARPRGTVSGTSRWLSSPWMRRLIVDWGIPSAAAASVRCPSSSASATSSLSPASGAPVKSGKCFIFGSYSSVHSLDGLFTEAHGETMTTHTAQISHLPDADVVLIGGGIMSATLGSMLALLEPQWRILVLEAAEDIATESSGPWNNAGTGHSGFCELNYTPDPADGSKASTIAEQFLLSRQWWAHLVQKGLLDPDAFVHSTAHMNLVFGAEHVAYLRTRVETLRADPLFAEMEYTEDPATIAQWAPLTME